MDNTITRWNDLEVLESSFTPLKETKSLGISDKLKLLILIFRISVAGVINLNGVVNDQINLTKRVDLGRRSAKFTGSSSHSSQIDNSGHTSEVLQNDSGGLERDFGKLWSGLSPVEDGLDV